MKKKIVKDFTELIPRSEENHWMLYFDNPDKDESFYFEDLRLNSRYAIRCQVDQEYDLIRDLSLYRGLSLLSGFNDEQLESHHFY